MPHGFCRRAQNLNPSMLNPKLETESQTPRLEAAGTLHFIDTTSRDFAPGTRVSRFRDKLRRLSFLSQVCSRTGAWKTAPPTCQ